MTDFSVLDDEPYQRPSGTGVGVWFMRQMRDLEGRSMDYLFDIQRLQMTLHDANQFALAFEWYIYHGQFNKDNVWDNDNLNGR